MWNLRQFLSRSTIENKRKGRESFPGLVHFTVTLARVHLVQVVEPSKALLLYRDALYYSFASTRMLDSQATGVRNRLTARGAMGLISA